MNNYFTIIITSVITLFIFFYFWAKYKLNYWQRKGVPTLPTNIIFGNFKDSFFQRTAPGFLFGELYHQVKNDPPYMGIYIMYKPFLLLRDPEIIKQMFVKDFNYFQNRYFTARNRNDRLGSDNLFSIHNPQWKYIRSKISPVFTSGKLKQLFGLIVETSDFLKSYLDDQFKEDVNGIKSIEAKEMSKMYTTDVVSSVAFGVRTNSFEVPTPEFYSRSSRKPTLLTAVQFFGMFFFPSLSQLFRFSFFGENTDFFRNVFWSSLNAREESKTERGDIIDSLIKLKTEKQESIFKFEGDSLVAQSAIFFIAGLESSSTTIAFALYELARNPEIQDRARKEIRENLKENGLTYDSVNNMKYLMQIINETLRLYPPAPILDRVADDDYQIPNSNVVIEKGTAVYVALPGIQKDPKYFPNPEQFDPDRFSEENKNKIPSCTFMPFGEGPRICIGARIGLLQTAIGLIRILEDYQVTVNDKHKVKIDTRIFFTLPMNGVHLFFKKINT
ncbi:cytochrome P450 6k1-like [Chelonus insularis]|uniref:cytochrome P450 6k1-like n=1 Tax=Chelonus insularis TaxID=460826 RepID=UPI00158B0DCF|nr:cytochrome P450 6k1-like [Chelonus insularis]